MEQRIVDYLTKQVQIDHNVVTYRALSRHFNIHVNTAKNHLAAFYAASRSSSRESVCATYMLTGDAAPPNRKTPQPSQDEMDVDTDGLVAEGDAREEEGDEPDSEAVPLTRIVLAGESDLESAKAQFLRLYSQVVYSLSPARLIDASLICPPTEKVYEADAKLTADAATLLGRLVGPHIRIGKPSPVVPPPVKSEDAPAPRRDVPKPPTVKAEKSEKQEEKPKFKPRTREDKPALKPKVSGFLDWGKAKTKGKDDDTKGKGKGKAKEEDAEGEKAKDKREESKIGKLKVKQEESKTDAAKGKSPSASSRASASSPEAEDTASSLEAEPSTKKDKPKEKQRGVKRKSVLSLSSDEEEAPRKKSPVVVPSKRAESPVVPKGKARESLSKNGKEKSSTAKPAVRRRSTRALMSDTDEDEEDEEEARAPSPPVVVRAKKSASKRVVVDSDEDESDSGARAGKTKANAKAKAKAKARPAVSKSLQAMMDIDDDEVIKASRRESDADTELDEEAPPETQTEDVVEDSEPERAAQRPAQRKKRQTKKPVPVGRNGLKKRRVMRTRTNTDAKGYMVTEDYSSYESVDEEEPEEPAKPKGRGKKGKKEADEEKKGKKDTDEGKKGKKGADEGKDAQAAEAKAASKDDAKVEKPEKEPVKTRKSLSKGGQGSLMNFFNSKPK